MDIEFKIKVNAGELNTDINIRENLDSQQRDWFKSVGSRSWFTPKLPKYIQHDLEAISHLEYQWGLLGDELTDRIVQIVNANRWHLVEHPVYLIWQYILAGHTFNDNGEVEIYIPNVSAFGRTFLDEYY